MSARSRQALALAVVVGILVTFAPLAAQAPASKGPAGKGKAWVVPRTPDGKPDLQGNWSNETQTPLERMGTQGATLTDDRGRGHRGSRARSSRSSATRRATPIAARRPRAATTRR